MRATLSKIFRGLVRIFPDCVTLSQAIAFNMFLAFCPMLLLGLGLLSNTSLFQSALNEIPRRLSVILPPGGGAFVAAYFARKGIHTRTWIILGLGGTLVAGTQVMIGFIDGFRVIEGGGERPSYWRLNLRALVLLLLTIAPMMAVTVLTMFGKPARAWLGQYLALPTLVRVLVFLGYAAVVFLLAMAALVAIYRIGRPGHKGLARLLPGAAVATILWWVSDALFGLYVRRMPYDAVYGGLAAAIGLLLWMYLTANVVLLGAAYNAESQAERKADRAVVRSVIRVA
jgi:YihY family inner membrane protein